MFSGVNGYCRAARYSDGFFVTYAYNTLDLTAVLESGSTTLASYGYDDLARRTSVSRANGATTSYAYDPISRLTSFSQDLAGSAYDLSVSGIAYNPASQIVSMTRSNDLYAWGAHFNLNRSYGVNGLNQLTSAGAVSIAHDARGNLTQHGASAYAYTVENRLSSGPGGVAITYDPLGRLAQLTQGAASTRFEHLGARLIAERSAAGTLLATNAYDEYGVPGAANLGRFQYTGQAWLPELFFVPVAACV